MSKKRRSELEIVVSYFTSAPLTEAGNALLVAKAIVAGRSPQMRQEARRSAPDKGRDLAGRDVPSGRRGRKGPKGSAGVEDETIANA